MGSRYLCTLIFCVKKVFPTKTCFEKKSLACIVALWLSMSFAWAEQRHACLGRITDGEGLPLECATVSLNQAFHAVTDADGKFSIPALPSGTYQYRISMVGFEATTGQVVVANADVRLDVTLHELSLQLTDVTVTARQVQMGSKSVIGQEAITHIQPKSVGDLLQLVPGNLVQNPDLNTLSQAQIRELDDDPNNAMGTCVVVDGMPIGNDANLEVLSATKYEEQSSGNNGTLSAHTTAGRGIDLRTLSAGNIESVEVVRGIPSVEYGNLTSGVVVVNSKAGHTPWEAKVQADPNSKLAYLSKGFRLYHGGALNLAADWAQSWADTRLHYKGYDRITASAGYSNQFGATSFNLHTALFTSVNEAKRDPQMTESHSEWTSSNRGARLGINGRYRSKETFITGIDYKLSANISRQHDQMSNWIYNPDGVITNTRQEGVQEAWFKRTGYNSTYDIESIPLDVYGQLMANRYMTLPRDGYTEVKVGLEYTLATNLGDGLTYDEDNPPQAQSAERLRPRAYSDIPGLNTMSFFANDRLSLPMGRTLLTADAGLRLSNLVLDRDKSGGNRGYLVAEPRANASLDLLHGGRIGALDDLTLTGGYGISHKMPTLLYLYPDCAYFDHVALGRWSDDEAGRLALIQTTIVRETANADLRPMQARKWEVGCSMGIGRNNISLTYYHEEHKREFGFMPQVMWIEYPFYTVPKGATDLAYDAATGQVTCTVDGVATTAQRDTYTERVSWSKPGNTSSAQKHGIEIIRIDLHKDEGYYDQDTGEYKMNYHAHVVASFLNWETGKTVKPNSQAMSEMQTILAMALDMERGERKAETGKEYLDHPQYKKMMEEIDGEKKKVIEEAKKEAAAIVDGAHKEAAAIKQSAEDELQSIQSEVKKAETRLKGLTTMLTNLEEQKDNIEAQIAALEDEYSENNEQMEQKRSELLAKLAEIEEKISDKTQKLKIAEQKLDGLTEKLASEESKFENLALRNMEVEDQILSLSADAAKDMANKKEKMKEVDKAILEKRTEIAQMDKSSEIQRAQNHANKREDVLYRLWPEARNAVKAIFNLGDSNTATDFTPQQALDVEHALVTSRTTRAKAAEELMSLARRDFDAKRTFSGRVNEAGKVLISIANGTHQRLTALLKQQSKDSGGGPSYITDLTDWAGNQIHR